ncbi:MAG: hypothetical protein RIR53_1080 [Bacteroidota bacterium]|jgi:hypothetical protein
MIAPCRARLLEGLLVVGLAACIVAPCSLASDGTKVFGGATIAYSRSANDLPAGRRSYTLQPSVNDRVGPMQTDLGLRYEQRGFHATIAFQNGWFADVNYVGEDFAYRPIQQAWIGMEITKQIAIRAGIMPSHIGYESINERENLVLSRLYCSDATPYYETGGAVVWQPSDALTVEGLILNGWQRIVTPNDDLAWGSRITWKPDSTMTFNWGTFYGNMFDRTATLQQPMPNDSWRFYNNFWAEWKPATDLTCVAIADVGRQQQAGDSTATVWSVAAIASYRLHTNWRVSARAEHFSDPMSVIVGTPQGMGFVASSLSTNIDWTIQRNIMLRAEIRSLQSADRIFPSSKGLITSDTFATVSVSYTLN